MATFDGHANFAYSTVATAPSPATTGTTLVVASGTGARFPTPPFNAVVCPASTQPLSTNAEVVRVTAVSTDTLTITRAQEGSSARTIIAGDQIFGAVTAKTVTDVELVAENATQAFGSRLWAFGHSWLQGGGTTHADRQFVTLLAGELRSDLRDLGVGGAQAALDSNWEANPDPWAASTFYPVNAIVSSGQSNYRCTTAHTSGATFVGTNWTQLSAGLYGYGGWAWVLQNVVPWRTTAATGAPYTPAANYLPLIQTGLNDLIQHVNDAGGFAVGIFKEALRTHISRICASRVYEDSDATVAYGGLTWQPAKADTTKNSGTTYRPLPGNTASVTITLPTDFEGGTVGIGFIVWPTSDGTLTLTAGAGLSAGASFRGSLLSSAPTLGLSNLAYNVNGVVPKRNGANGVTLRVSGLVAADAGKTIIVTYSGGAGTAFSAPASGVRTDTATVTNASATVTDASIVAADQGKPVSGTGIPNGAYVGTVTAGVSFLLSSSATSQVNVTATGAGTSVVIGLSRVGTSGATTYTYARVYRTYNGDTTLGTTFSTTLGNATLSGTNYNVIGAGPQWPAGVEQELIIRTAGGTPGLIAILYNGPANVNDQIPAATGGTYTAPTALPKTGGAAFDYWQIESNAPATKVAVCNIPVLPAAELTAQGVTSANFTSYNAAISAVAAEWTDQANQVTVVDIDSAMAANAAYFVGVHPNDRGHAVVAAKISQAITTWVQGFTDLERIYQARVRKGLGARALAVSPNAGDVNTSKNWGPGRTGIYTLTGSWADVDPTNLALSIDAQVGDDIEVSVSGLWSNNSASNGLLDIAVVDASGNVISYFSTGTSSPGLGGQSSWFAVGSAWVPIGGEAIYTVRPADITSASFVWGVVNLRLRGTGSGRALYCGNTGIQISMHVKNLGQRNTPGFNAS